MQEYKTGLHDAAADRSIDFDTARFVVVASTIESTNAVKENPLSDIEREGIAIGVRENALAMYEWFQKEYGGSARLLERYVGSSDKEVTAALQEQIGKNISHWVMARRSLGKTKTGLAGTDERELSRMADFLLQNSMYFHELGARHHLKGESWPQDTETLVEQARLQEEVLSLDPTIEAFEMRDWITKTAKEARRGRRIFETPYYMDKISQIHDLGRKKNGVGGVILYGPPGVGKTEVVQEKNRQEGYNTRVINVHYYTSFDDLMASRAIQLGIDQGASTAQKLKAVLEVMEGEDSASFERSVKEMYQLLRQEGKLQEDDTFPRFLSSLVSVDMGELTKPEVELDWGKLQEGFVDRQRTRVLRASLSPGMQEGVEDVVRGEILLAIQRGERVLLDEVDKAGPRSLGGVLTFLAQSPGQIFEFGTSSVVIPHWFKVDATSNAREINEFFKDRFSHVDINTPPVKDQLMIAAVRVSDDEGNCLLNPHEQRQLAAFFMYVVPEINSNLYPPLSNRGIQELTSYIVDYGNMERTTMSVEHAIRKFMLENKLWEGQTVDGKTAQEILKGLVERYKGVFSNAPSSERGELPREQAGSRAGDFRSALEQTVRSPFIQVINGLPEAIDYSRERKVVPVALSLEQQRVVQEKGVTRRKDLESKASAQKLPTGLATHIYEGDLSLLDVSSGREPVILHSIPTTADRIIDSSSDGSKVAIMGHTQEGKNALYIDEFFNEEPLAGRYVSEGGIVEMDDQGRYVAILDEGKLTIVERGEKALSVVHTKENVRSMSLAPGGKHVISNGIDGNSFLIDLASFSTVAQLKEGNWMFMSNELIIDQSNQEIGQSAYLMVK